MLFQDPLAQYPAYVTYAANNPYRQLVSTSTIANANNSLYRSGGCIAQIQNCYATGSRSISSGAQGYCNTNVLTTLRGNYDIYYVPSPNPDPYPPDITPYLTNSTIASAIGAQATWTVSDFTTYVRFTLTGDWMQNSSPDLEKVIDSGVRTVIYVGDADFLVNFWGIEAMVRI